MPSAKRPSEESNQRTPSSNKIARTDDGDFSSAVKKKLSGASRTGQACDRCKVRKIRCDARVGGCSPCNSNNLECRTTDRITGRATSRGYTENIEQENNNLRQYLTDLRQQLQEHGIEPCHPAAQAAPVAPQAIPNISQPSTYTPDPILSLAAILNPINDDPRRIRSAALPDFKSDDVGNNYLGVGSANEWPMPITGTRHALFGMHIDLKDFVPEHADERTRAMSYNSFYEYTLRGRQHQVKQPPLPEYRQLRSLVEWYFKSLNCWHPILHKPTFLEMIDRMHSDPSYSLSIPQKVQLHLVIATMLYQYTTRNGRLQQNEFLDHYRYGLSFHDDLVADTTLEGLQALAVIIVFLRGFPQPGAVWMVSTFGLIKAIEIGLHRSVTAWDHQNVELDAHTVELRKRIFWSILMCHVTVGEKLGRPLVLKLEDFDIEMPRIINDDMPGENFPDEFSKCSFRYGVYAFQVTALHLQIYSNLYTVRPTAHQPYEQNVQKLGKELNDWYSSLPSEMVQASADSPHRVAGLYMEHSYRHQQLMLHHPALCKSPTQEITAKNLDICLEASSRLLVIAGDLQKLKSLDTTWHNTAIFLAAIFTTLFSYLERKEQITSSELTKIQNDMDKWGDIMGDIGTLLGSGPHLQVALARITSSVIGNISKHIAARTASAAVATAAMNRSPAAPHIEQPADQQVYHQPPVYMNQYPSQPTGSQEPGPNSNYIPTDPSLTAQHQAYPTSYAYPEPAHTAMQPYTQPALSYDTSYSEDIKPELSAHLSQPQSTYFYPSNSQPPSVAWRQFADNMMTSMTPHWSANALMAMQNQGQGSPPGPTNNKGSGSPAVTGAEINGGAAPNGGQMMEHGHPHAHGHGGVHGHGAHVHGGGGVGFDLGAHPQHWPMMYNANGQ